MRIEPFPPERPIPESTAKWLGAGPVPPQVTLRTEQAKALSVRLNPVRAGTDLTGLLHMARRKAEAEWDVASLREIVFNTTGTEVQLWVWPKR